MDEALFLGKGARYNIIDIILMWTSMSLRNNLILEVMNQEGKVEEMKQWLYICCSIIGSVLFIIALMKLYWYCIKQ